MPFFAMVIQSFGNYFDLFTELILIPSLRYGGFVLMF